METVAGDTALTATMMSTVEVWHVALYVERVVARICDCLRHNIFISDFQTLPCDGLLRTLKKVYHFTSSHSHSERQEKKKKRNETTHEMMETVQTACICKCIIFFGEPDCQTQRIKCTKEYFCGTNFHPTVATNTHKKCSERKTLH